MTGRDSADAVPGAGARSDRDLALRVAALEAALEKDKKSFARRFGLWGGLVALVLSILAGTLGLFDRVNNALAAHDREVAKAQDVTSALLSISSRVDALAVQGKLGEAEALSRSMGPEIARHLDTLAEFDKAVLDDLGSSDLVAISLFTLNRGNQEAAIAYADIAFGNAPNDFVRAEAIRDRAVAKYTSGPMQDISGARADMRQAMSFASEQAGPAREQAKADVLTWWVGYEAVFGECDKAKQVAGEYSGDIRLPADAFGRQKQAIAMQIGQMGSTCEIPW